MILILNDTYVAKISVKLGLGTGTFNIGLKT
jgi:hypothetical protein